MPQPNDPPQEAASTTPNPPAPQTTLAGAPLPPPPPPPISPPPTPPPQPGLLNLGDILLPKKDARDPRDAQRIAAGTLLAQEQAATLPKPPAPPPAASAAPRGGIEPLETYQGDMQKYIERNKVSEVTIAAAEATRRGNQGDIAREAESTSEEGGNFWLRLLAIFVGSLLLGGALGLVGYMIYRSQTVPLPAAPQAPVIAIDEVHSVALLQGDPHAATLGKLIAARDAVHLPLGLVAQIMPVIVATTSGTAVPLDANTFFAMLAPGAPQDLARTLLPQFLLGVHSFAGNQPFIILKTDSYEQAFAGMLAWEPYLRGDLLPLFAVNPGQGSANTDVPPIASTQPPATPTATATTSVASTSASNTPSKAATTSTSATSSPAALGPISATSSTSAAASSSAQAPTGQFLQTGFLDKILENHDTRVLQDASGQVYLLWTFLDRNTILITTSPDTLKEIISRIHDAPIVPTPGQ